MAKPKRLGNIYHKARGPQNTRGCGQTPNSQILRVCAGGRKLAGDGCEAGAGRCPWPPGALGSRLSSGQRAAGEGASALSAPAPAALESAGLQGSEQLGHPMTPRCSDVRHGPTLRKEKPLRVE